MSKPVGLKTRWWIYRRAMGVSWLDLRARAAGYCNHCPWSPDPTESGGYDHWRCALPRGHDDVHRYRNYVWDEDRDAVYDPVPHDQTMPNQPWERTGPSLAQLRRGRKVWKRKLTERRARSD